jgi:CheY-like chemotaxis protein
MTLPLTIFLAEDDDGHATLIRRNIERARLGAEIVRFRDGQELLDAFAAGPETHATVRRVVVFLDISMPRVDGLEVLRRLKSDRVTSAVPVYVLTTTDNPFEVDRCCALGCNAYVTKPVAYDAFVEAIERLCAFLAVTQVPGLPDRSGRVFA